MRRLSVLHAPTEFSQQYDRLRPLIETAREAMADIESRFSLEFEQASDLLYLVRGAQEWKLTEPALDLLRQYEIPHQVLSAAQCVELEHAVPAEPDFAGGVRLATGRTANCPLFTKLLKLVLDAQGGVQFHFGREVTGLRLESSHAAVELAPRPDEAQRSREVEVIRADAIVIAAGTGSLPLLERHGARLPLHPLRLHTLVAPIAHEECAPHRTVIDAIKRIAITRMNHRLRIAGAAVLQSAIQTSKPLDPALFEEALALLGQATHDWVPGAAKISAALPWQGVKLLSPDGLPAVGKILHPRLFMNAGHGPAGWGLACGTAKVIAALVSGTTPEVPADTLAALQPERFLPA